MSPGISIRLLAAQTDQRLVGLAREGHERAFEALVHRYRRPLLRYGRRMGLSDARAEDVLQQALLRAWLALARGAEVRDLKPWLYRIVHNAAVNAMRASPEAHTELTEATQARAIVAGESNLERRIAVREALSDVADLPQMQRQAIFLTAVDGQSNREVASSLGISEGALRGLLYRARATLRSAAAALTPAPLLKWASGGSGAAGPTAERLTELTAGGGAAGIAGLVLKGAVVAVTAGAVASGAAVVDRHHHSRPTRHQGSLVDNAGSAPTLASAVGGTSPAGASGTRIGAAESSKAVRQGGRRRGHGGDGQGRKGERHGLSETDRENQARSNGGGGQDDGKPGGGQGVDVADAKGDGGAGSSGHGDGQGAQGSGGKGAKGADDSAANTADGVASPTATQVEPSQPVASADTSDGDEVAVSNAGSSRSNGGKGSSPDG